MRKPLVFMLLGVLVLFAAPLPAFAGKPLPGDTDKDGTLDQAEVDAAAGAAFDKLDKDKDGSLTWKEVSSRLSKSDFAAAETDNDKTLSKAEFTAAADKQFAAADTDHDGTVDASELKTRAGKALEKLIK